jgi:type III secretory pathway component EscS
VWVVRELLRLLSRIAVAVLIAIVIAEVRTLSAGGDTMHAFQISLLVIGATLIALAAMSPGSAYSRRLDYVAHRWNRAFGADSVGVRIEGPELTPAAVFVGSGLVVLVLGFLV